METKRIAKMGENNPLTADLISRDVLALTWPKKTQQHPRNRGYLLPLAVQHKNGLPQLGNEKQQQKRQGRILASDPFPINFPNMGKI